MHGDSLLMLTTKVVSNKKPSLLSVSESGGSTSPGYYSRRINIRHRLVYEVLEEKKIVRIIRMWTYYE